MTRPEAADSSADALVHAGFEFAFFPSPTSYATNRTALATFAAVTGFFPGLLGIALLVTGGPVGASLLCIVMGLGCLALFMYFVRLAQHQLRWARKMTASGEPSVSYDGEALWAVNPVSSICITRENLAGAQRIDRRSTAISVHDLAPISSQLPPRPGRLRAVLRELGSPNVACVVTSQQVSGKLRELESAIAAVVDTQ